MLKKKRLKTASHAASLSDEKHHVFATVVLLKDMFVSSSTGSDMLDWASAHPTFP